MNDNALYFANDVTSVGTGVALRDGSGGTVAEKYEVTRTFDPSNSKGMVSVWLPGAGGALVKAGSDLNYSGEVEPGEVLNPAAFDYNCPSGHCVTATESLKWEHDTSRFGVGRAEHRPDLAARPTWPSGTLRHALRTILQV